MTAKAKQTRQAKPWFKKNWVYVVGVAGIISATVAVINFVRPADHPPSNVIGGNCAQVGNGNSCTVAPPPPSNLNPQQLKDNIARQSLGPPKPPGPWPYFIFDTVNIATGQDVGLAVKTAPSVEGEPVGTAPAGSLVWADCFVMNDYNPEAGNSVDVGPKWLRIHWPTGTSGSTTYSRSSTHAPFLEYVYAGYALPYTHNGNIPQCP